MKVLNNLGVDNLKVKQEITNFIFNIKELFKSNNYVAKSDYRFLIKKFKLVYDDLSILNNYKILDEYCYKNNLNKDEVVNALNLYENIEYFIERRNEKYIYDMLIKEKDYLDNILKSVDKDIKLDNEQRKVVLCDEDYTLVIAGAGAGKTTTVAAKVKYLVEKKNLDPKDILIISFTNKAVQELKNRINKDLKLDCPITTFHSTGYAILKKDTEQIPVIIGDGKLYYLILDYMKNKILKNESLVSNLLLFFSTYFNHSYTGEELKKFFNQISIPYSTLRSDLNEYRKKIVNSRTKKMTTINNECLRSQEEVAIANFLYLHNLDYEYEPLYRFNIKFANKPYTPDFKIKQDTKEIYLEHFGISEDGRNSLYTAEELLKYKKIVNKKILLHKKHNTKLIYTFSKYNDGKSITEHLKEALINHGFILKPKPKDEVLKKIISTEESKYISKLVTLICRFISNYKVNGYNVEEFRNMARSTTNVRAKLFLNICHECYLEYQKYLKEHNAIDFQDMINESAKMLNDAKINNKVLTFKYIIVDEYQDISKQRFDLTKALSDICEAKIMVVGDDWQSIYAFSGSDIELFTKFKEKMGYGQIIKITNTYRNSQELIDIAGDFVQKNEKQIKKELKSPKNISDPVIIYTYDNTKKWTGANNKTGANYNLAYAINLALEDIINKSKNPEEEKILILSRFNFEGNNLERSGLFEFKNYGNKVKSVKYPFLNITLMTAHSSKGLGYDNVIIINGKNDLYGFPSKIEDDPVLSFVIKGDRAIDYAEERRLFYVALTRTKNRVYFVAPKQNPSEFLLEIKKDYKNVILNGEWNENLHLEKKNKCPICGFPLQKRISNVCGMPLYICTNEPEICGFMTNNINGGKLAIQKCDKCYDGYLIVKENLNDKTYFLGCTNYVPLKGCDNYISQKDYYLLNNLILEPKLEIVPVLKNVKKRPEKIDNVEIKANINLNDNIPQIILNCINYVSETKYFGILLYVDLFKGSYQKKITENNLHKLPYFGLFKNLDRNFLRNIIEKLIEKEYLNQTKGLYPVLHPTYKGLNTKISTNLKNELVKTLNQ